MSDITTSRRAFVAGSGATLAVAATVTIPAIAFADAPTSALDQKILTQSARLNELLVQRVNLTNDQAAGSFWTTFDLNEAHHRARAAVKNLIGTVDAEIEQVVAELNTWKPVSTHARQAQKDALGACKICLG